MAQPHHDPAVIAADWGTTSLRLWALDPSGNVLGEHRAPQGMSMLAPDAFHPVLEATLDALGIPTDTPAILCGMVGAAQGWHEAPYVSTPTDLSVLSCNVIRVQGSRPRDVRILPGLAQCSPNSADVMRGEETILLGAIESRGLAGPACLPGTHSKWAQIEDGRITGFSTFMTGEVFSLLAQHSTLSPYLKVAAHGTERSEAFAQAVREALEQPQSILKALFSIRARPLLDPQIAQDMPARLSGLLIGLEIAGQRAALTGPVTLISSGQLARSYARAFDLAGLPFNSLSADDMACAGLCSVARTLWPSRFEF